ncbi:MAG: tetratricopeptide repeat protein, partial [Deltaproteobacteria bacterium]|nr:tetratricopeptide repeat protein [Deltaproteobacteria bacterium]
MSIELIRGELERLYALEEMLALSSELLGFEPGMVGGTASPGSFARALTDHCQQHDAIAALIDAVTSTKPDASPQLQLFVADVLRAPVELKASDTVGKFMIVRKIGTGPNGTVYATKRNDISTTVKLLHASAIHNKTELHRFLTRNRLLAKIEHDSLPQLLEAGFVDGKPYVAYEAIEAKPLAPRIARTGALHINEARALLIGLLNGLKAIHDANLVHGAMKLENVLVSKNDDGSPKVVLIDAGGDLLSSSWIHSDVASTGGNRIKGLAPEQLKGLGTSAKSDMYGFGALLFEVLTGKPPLEEKTATELAVAHLSKEPGKASKLAPRGWVSEDLSLLCSGLLAKDPSARPDIDEVLTTIGPLEKPKDSIEEDELNDCIDLLVADPTDIEAAITLEVTLERGADQRKVADAFLMAADQLNLDEVAKAARADEESEAVADMKSEAARDRAREQKKGLIFRAARLYETQVKDFAKSEDAYKWLIEIAPADEVAKNGFEKALKAQDKLAELIDHLLVVSQKSPSHTERGLAMNKIGHLYLGPLEDPEQACFAFGQALAQDVQNDQFADDLEKAAADDMNLWADAMRALHEVSEHPGLPQEVGEALFMRLGRWYSEKIARPDLAVRCFETVLNLDPANQAALEGMTAVYRRAQQWTELVTVIRTRIDRATTPERARDLRAEAAELLETRLDDLGSARDLYEATLKEDPGHQKTVDALARIYKRNDDYLGYVKILEQQAEALTGHPHAEALCKMGEIYEDQLKDIAEAQRRYEGALQSDPGSMTAIRALDRVFSQNGRYQDLLDNLDKQVALAATPRQKINLYQRIAGIQDEEFLDHEKAADAWEKVLELDGGHEGALTSLMRHYRALDRWDDVIELYDRSLSVCADEARRVELLLSQARILLDFGSPERARLAYENVLQLDPGNAQALESLANVRAATGDAMAALTAVESLAAKAETPDQKAELWIRAAKILEEHGDRDGAITRYKQALDARPDDPDAMHALRSAYLDRGDAASATEIIVQEIGRTEGKLAQAELYTELARLKLDKLADKPGAREAAVKAVDLDSTNVTALFILGNLAFEAESYNEASTHLGALVPRAELLDKDDARRMLMRYMDSLTRSGSAKEAIGAVDSLLNLSPDDPEALMRAGRVLLAADDAKRAAELYGKLHNEHGDALKEEDQARAMLDYGISLRKAGDLEEALAALTDAADMLPDALEPINELAEAYAAQKDWEMVVTIKQRRLDLAEGEERADLLLEIGEVLASEIKDATRAAKAFVVALEERPDSRKVLTRLMKLYSEEKDWQKLVDVVLKLSNGVDDPKLKAKYVHTAAGVCSRQLGDLDAAIEYLDQVLDLDPENEKALQESIEVREQKGDHEGVIGFLNIVLERAEKAGDEAAAIETVDRIAEIYET